MLSHSPIVPKSVRLTVGNDQWHEIDDLLSAGPEVPTPDHRYRPEARQEKIPWRTLSVTPESGEIKFGDGLRGKRPPVGAPIPPGYDYGAGKKATSARDPSTQQSGAAGRDSKSAIPSGRGTAQMLNPWEKEKSRLPAISEHRDRLVTGDDFETITLRTPGVEIGRVEVIPAFNPEAFAKRARRGTGCGHPPGHPPI